MSDENEDVFLIGEPIETHCPGCGTTPHWAEGWDTYQSDEDGMMYDLFICKAYVPTGDGWEKDCNQRVFFRRSPK